MAVSVSMTYIFTKPRSLTILVQFVWVGLGRYIQMWQSKREISRECNDIIGSAKGSQISEKYWGEVGKGKKGRRLPWSKEEEGAYLFEWNKCLWFRCYIFVTEKNALWNRIVVLGKNCPFKNNNKNLGKRVKNQNH